MDEFVGWLVGDFVGWLVGEFFGGLGVSLRRESVVFGGARDIGAHRRYRS